MMGNSKRYQLLSPDGTDDWAHLATRLGARVHNRQSGEVRTVAMFHQLECLVHMSRAFREFPSISSYNLNQHCLNYMRQALLCHAETRLEPVHSLKGPGYVSKNMLTPSLTYHSG